MRTAFIAALAANEPIFDITLTEQDRERLADFFELILEHNPLLHLVAPCSPEEMATRHFLESMAMLKHLPQAAKFTDVGSGGGFPAIPCLLVREDLHAILIESKEKKAAFLTTAVTALKLGDHVTVSNKQFSESETGESGSVTCRALDKFTDRLPRLLKWAGRRKLLLFGSDNLADALRAAKRRPVGELMPLSQRRYLYVIEN